MENQQTIEILIHLILRINSQHLESNDTDQSSLTITHVITLTHTMLQFITHPSHFLNSYHVLFIGAMKLIAH